MTRCAPHHLYLTYSIPHYLYLTYTSPPAGIACGRVVTLFDHCCALLQLVRGGDRSLARSQAIFDYKTNDVVRYPEKAEAAWIVQHCRVGV